MPFYEKDTIVGDLFSYRNDKSTKKELVVFLRPLVVKNASLDGDLARFRRNSPQRLITSSGW